MLKFFFGVIVATFIAIPSAVKASAESSFATHFLNECIEHIGLIDDYQSFAEKYGWTVLSPEQRKSFGGKIGDNETGAWIIETDEGTEFAIIFQEGKTEEGKTSYGCSLLTKKGDFAETVIELKRQGQVHKIRDVNTSMMFVQMFMASHSVSGKSMVIAMKNKTKPSGADNGGFAVTITK